MNNVIILASFSLVGVVVAAVALRHRGSRTSDLGSVSSTWIAELRAGDPYDSGR